MAVSRNSSGFYILIATGIALMLFLGAVLSGFLSPSDDEGKQTVDATDGAGVGDGDEESANETGYGAMELQFKKWPVPKAALILTGEQHGYIEPCGCTENQSGGVSRRGELIRQLEELKWKTAGLDAGGLVRRTGPQAELKFATMVSALQDLNYKATALGVEDMRLMDTLLSVHQPDVPENIAFLCANAVFYESPDLGTPAHAKIFSVGGLSVGVTAVIGKSFAPDLANLTDIKINEPSAVLPTALEGLNKEELDLKVLLSHGTLDEAKKLAVDFSDFDIILATGGPEDPDGRPIQVEGTQTLVLNVGKKGKNCGILAVYPDGDPKFRFELVQLDRDRFPKDTPKMIEHMRNYQANLRDRELIANEPPVPHPSGATYVGSQACADCHEEEYQIWKKSPHASAFKSLDPANKRHGYERLKGILRAFDAECVCCHTTGWNPTDIYRYRTGFINKRFAATEEDRRLSPLLEGSGCENCHGPGSQHIEIMENGGNEELAGKMMRMTLKQANSIEGCYKCHDNDNSPNFSFKDYWPKIAHGPSRVEKSDE